MKLLPGPGALALLLLAAGCSAPAQQLVPFPSQDVAVTRDDLTRIYFLREGWVGVQNREIVVFDGETEIGALTPDTYLCWERPGGRTLGRAFYKAVGPLRGELEGIADLDCGPGRAYYFNVTVRREDGQPEVQALDPEEGRRLVAQRRPAGKP